MYTRLTAAKPPTEINGYFVRKQQQRAHTSSRARVYFENTRLKCDQTEINVGNSRPAGSMCVSKQEEDDVARRPHMLKTPLYRSFRFLIKPEIVEFLV